MKITKEKKWISKTTVLIVALIIGFITIQLVTNPGISGETDASSFGDISERQNAVVPRYLDAINSADKEVLAENNVEVNSDTSTELNNTLKSNITPRAFTAMDFNTPVFNSIGRYRIKIIGNSNVQSFFGNDLLRNTADPASSIYAMPKYSNSVSYTQVAGNSTNTVANSSIATLNKAKNDSVVKKAYLVWTGGRGKKGNFYSPDTTTAGRPANAVKPNPSSSINYSYMSTWPIKFAKLNDDGSIQSEITLTPELFGGYKSSDSTTLDAIQVCAADVTDFVNAHRGGKYATMDLDASLSAESAGFGRTNPLYWNGAAWIPSNIPWLFASWKLVVVEEDQSFPVATTVLKIGRDGADVGYTSSISASVPYGTTPVAGSATAEIAIGGDSGDLMQLTGDADILKIVQKDKNNQIIETNQLGSTTGSGRRTNNYFRGMYTIDGQAAPASMYEPNVKYPTNSPNWNGTDIDYMSPEYTSQFIKNSIKSLEVQVFGPADVVVINALGMSIAVEQPKYTIDINTDKTSYFKNETIKNTVVAKNTEPITNTSALYNSKIDIVIPSGSTYVPGTLKLGGVAIPDSYYNGTTRTFTVPVGAATPVTGLTRSQWTDTITFDTVATVTGSFNAEANIYGLLYSNLGESTGYNMGIMAEDTTPYDVIYSNLGLTKSAVDVNGGVLERGDVVEYTIVANNTNGDIPITNVTLTDPIPANMTYVPGSMKVNGIGVSDLVDTDIGSFGSNQVTVVNPIIKATNTILVFRVTVNSSITGTGALVNTVTASSPDLSENKTATATVTPKVPIIEITKVVDQSTPPNAGTNYYEGTDVKYKIEFKNTGTGTALGVQIVDTLPSGMTYVSSSPTAASVTGNIITWDVGTVAPGDTETVTVTGKISPFTGANKVLKNTVVGKTNNAADGQVTADVTINATPRGKIKSTKVANKLTPNRGDVITYSIDVWNELNSNAIDNVAFHDSIPANLTYVPGTLKVDGVLQSDTNVVSNVINLTLNGVTNVHKTVTFDVTVGSNVAAGTVIRNTANLRDPLDVTNVQEPFADVTVIGPILVLSKIVNSTTPPGSDGLYRPGDTIKYDVKVTNTGAGTAFGVTMTDTLPTDFTLVDGAGGTPVGRTVVWNVGTILSGASVTKTITVTIDGNASSGSYENKLSAKTNNTLDPVPTEAKVSVDVTAIGDVTLTKKNVDVNGGLVERGDIIEYTIEATNTVNNSVVRNATIEDIVPTGLTYIAGTLSVNSMAVTDAVDTDAGSVTGKNVSGAIGNLVYGTPKKIIFKVRVDGSVSNNTSIVNTGTLKSIDIPTPKEATSTINVVGPVLDSIKTVTSTAPSADGKYRVNDTVTYDLKLKNTGAGLATGTVITDILDSQFTFVNATGGAVNGTYNAATRTVTWNTGNILAGQEKIVKLTVKITSVTSTQIGNVFTGVTDNEKDSPSVSPEVFVPVTVPGSIAAEKLVLDENGGNFERGDVVTYTINVWNKDNTTPIYNVKIEDLVPDGLTYVPGSIVINGGAVTDAVDTDGGNFAGNKVNAEIIEVKNTKISVKFKATINMNLAADLTIKNIATVTDPLNPTVPVRPEVDLNAKVPRLEGEKTEVSDPVSPDNNYRGNEIVTYELRIKNAGNGIATGVTLKDTLPAGLSFESATGAYTLTGKEILWTLGNLNPGEEKKFTVNAKVIEGTTGTQINEMLGKTNNVVDKPVESKPGINAVPTGNISATKAVLDKNGGKAERGDILTYTIKVKNPTNSTSVYNVEVSDFIPSQLTFVAGTLKLNGVSAGSYDTPTRTVNVVIPEVTNIDSVITFDVSVNNDIPNDITVKNVAVVKDPSDPEVPVKPEIPIDIVTPRLNGSKVVTSSPRPDGLYRPGDTLAYELTIKNEGNGIAKGVVLTDTIPTGFNYVSSSPSGTFALNKVSWNIGDLASGAEVKVTVTGVVTDNFQGKILNTMTGETNNPLDPKVIKTAEVEAGQKGVLGSTKSVTDINGGKVERGDILEYTITTQNTLNSNTMYNVKVEDVIPANTTYVAESIKVNNTPKSDAQDTDNGHYDAGTKKIGVVIPTLTNVAQSVKFSVRVNDNFNVKTEIVNVAVVTDPDDPTNPVNPEVKSEIVTPKLEGEKTVVTPPNAGTSYFEGSEITYQLRIKNTGEGVAEGVTLVDILPTNMTYVSSTPNVGNQNGKTLTWNIGNLNSGSEKIVTVVGVIDSGYEGKLNNKMEGKTINPVDEKVTSEKEIESVLRGKVVGTKSVRDDNGGLVERGDTLTYTIGVKNNTNSTIIKDVEIIDNIPTGLTYVPGSMTLEGSTLTDVADSDEGQFSSKRVKVVVPSVTNVEKVVIFKVTVDEAVKGNTEIKNVAIVTDPLFPLEPKKPEALVEVVGPELELLKEVDSSTPPENDNNYRPGNEIKYNLKVSNVGEGKATGVVLTDTLPIEATYKSSSDNGSHAGGKVTWNIGTLLPNEVKTVSVVILVGETPDGKLTNTLTGKTINPEDPTPNPSIKEVPVVPNGAVTSVKTFVDINGGKVERGDVISYKITTTNTVEGSVSRSMTIKDVIPTGMTYVSGSIKVNGLSKTDQVGDDIGEINSNEVYGNIGDINHGVPGTLEFKVTVNENVSSKTNIKNIAVVEGPDVPTFRPEVELEVEGPRLSGSKEVTSTPVHADGKYREGDTVTYKLTLSNISEVTSKGSKIEDTLDGNFEFVSGTGDVLGVYDSVSHKVTWNFGDMLPNTTKTALLSVKIKTGASGNITNAMIGSTINPLDPIVEPPVVTIVVAGKGRVKAEKLESGSKDSIVQRGDTITYTVNVWNDENTTEIYNVKVEDLVPEGLTFVPGSIKVSGVSKTDAVDGDGGNYANNTVTGTIPVVTDKKTSIVFKATVDMDLTENLDIKNIAKVVDPLDPTKEEKPEVDVAVKVPVLEGEKTVVGTPASADGKYREGELITYKIRIKNVGDGIAKKVTIEDTMPEGLDFISSTKPSTNLGKVHTWGPKDMLPGEEEIIEIQARVNSKASGIVKNIMIGKTDNPVDKPVTSDPEVEASPKGNLEARKAVSDLNGGKVERGDTLSYTIGVKNKTNTTEIYNVDVSDVIPSGLTYVPGTLKLDGNQFGTYDSSGKLINVIIPKVNHTESLITFEVTVDLDIPNDKIIKNVAVISNPSNPDEELMPEVTVDVVTPNLIGNKKVISIPRSDDQHREGDIITYEVTIKNTGNGIARNVVLKDLLPSTLKFESATGGGIHNEGVVTWTIGDMAKDEEFTYLVFASVHAGVSDIVENHLLGETDNPIDKKVTDKKGIVVAPKGEIGSVKTVTDVNGGAVERGDILTYTITTNNKLNSTEIYDVEILDVIPAGTTYVKDSIKLNQVSKTDAASDDEGTFTTGTHEVKVVIPVVASANQVVTFDVRVKDDIDENTEIKNVATVKDPINPEPIYPEVTIEGEAPLLEGSKELISVPNAGTSFFEGSTVVYELKIKNVGDGVAKGVVVTDTLPISMSFVSSVPTATSIAGNVGTWSIGDLQKDEEKSIRVTTIINKGVTGELKNTMEGRTENPKDKKVTGEKTITSELRGEMETLKEVVDENGGLVERGDILTYSIKVRNKTNNTFIDNVLVEDLIPVGTTYVKDSLKLQSQTLTDAVDSDGGSFSANKVKVVIEKVNNEYSTVQFQVTVNDSVKKDTEIKNVAIVTDPENPVNPGKPEVSVDVVGPSIAVKKVVDESTPPEADGNYKIGNTIKYNLSVINNGEGLAKGVTLTDTLPLEATYKGSEPAGMLVGNKVTWDVGDLQPNETKSVTITLLVGKTPDGILTNVLSGKTINPEDPEPPVSKVEVKVSPISDIIAEKSFVDVNGGVVERGDVISYKILVTNTVKDSVSRNVKIEDVIPTGMTYVPNTIKVNGMKQTDGKGDDAGEINNINILGTLGDVYYGIPGSLEFNVTINNDVNHNTVIKNIALVSGDDIDEPQKPEVDTKVSVSTLIGSKEEGSSSIPKTGGFKLFVVSLLFISSGTLLVLYSRKKNKNLKNI